MVELALKPSSLPVVRGRYTANAPLGEVGWFHTGGRAEVLYKPADRADLVDFMVAVPPDIPVTVLGVLSNVIVRDGGVPGVVIRLGRDFATIVMEEETLIRSGAAALDSSVSEFAAQSGVSELEFLSGVPGTIGGALVMNAGAYGGEVKDILVEATILHKTGEIQTLSACDLSMSYRHTDFPEGAIFLEALFKGTQDFPSSISSRLLAIRDRRRATQPIHAYTGGSTFANPSPDELVAAGFSPETKTWQLIHQVGGRGLQMGGAQISEKHTNFMINTGTATAQDLEDLGEEIRRRVKDQCGIDLRWEVKRIGIPNSPDIPQRS